MIDRTLFLNQLVENLYGLAAGKPPLLNIPLQIVDSPEVAHQIFNKPEQFLKNYSFLEKLSQGRFSANGQDWVARAKLTQHFYHQSTHTVEDGNIADIYAKNFLGAANNSASNLWNHLIAAAIEVISLSYGLKQSIPWPSQTLKPLLDALAYEQSEAWLNPKDISKVNNTQLDSARCLMVELWRNSSELRAFIDNMAVSAGMDNDFIVGELLQNLLAASETTASAFSWLIDTLGRNQKIQDILRNDPNDIYLEYFIDEVLRLYPPVPFVTRKLSDSVNLGHMKFSAGEYIIVSIIGLHSHATYWQTPAQFQFPRSEFVSKSYHPQAFRPFISGPRVCGGMRLAKRELLIGLRTLLGLYRVKPILGNPLLSYGLTMRPGIDLDGCLVRINA